MTAFPITLLAPAWLLLAVPLGLLAWWLRPARPALRWLRGAVFGLLLLALARPAVLLPSRAGTLVVVADRSASMPEGAQELQREVIDRLQDSQPEGDRLAVLSFGETAALDHPPQAGRFSGFTARVGGGQSNLAEALEAALALLPENGPGRLLLLTDGRWTGRDPVSLAGRAALREVAVDYRRLERPAAADLAVDRVDAPQQVRPGEAYLLTAWVRNPVAGPVRFELRRGAEVLAAGERDLPSGLSRLTFRDRAGGPGTFDYRFTVAPREQAAGEDPLPGNETAAFLVGVEGPRPVLVAGQGEGLAELLRRGGLEVRRPGSDFGWTAQELSEVSAVILADLPAAALGTRGMETLAAWVEAAGGGLMMTGGRQSFGPGGYFRSPLEEVLPVSMELRQEHRKFAVAMVVTLDRSGSMAAEAGGGRTKMDLANLAAVEVLDLLSPLDEFGLVVVDSQAHVIAPLVPVPRLATPREAILRIDSEGGGIFVYEALEAAAEQLLSATAGTRHVLLFADAADAEAPGEYQALLGRCRQAGITVSVVGLGKEDDTDAELLRDVARRGGGEIYFTQSAEELPRLFVQDTFRVARSTFIEERTPQRATGGLATLTGRSLPELADLGGYNLTYARPGAELAVLTRDEYEAPVVAAWQAGLGRVLAYAAQVEGAFAGNFPGGMGTWAGTADLLTSLTRWTAGMETPATGASGTAGWWLRQRVEDGFVRVNVDLDPERAGDPFLRPPRLSVLRAAPGASPAVEAHALRWVDPDRLEALVPLRGDDVVLVTVDGGGPQANLAPVRLPYSPEFRPARPGSGQATLEVLARATGGGQRLDLAGLWNEFPRQRRPREIAPALLLLAVGLFLLEVLERRTALLRLWAGQGWRLPRLGRSPRAAASPRPPATVPPEAVPPPVPASEPPAELSPPAPSLDEALERARRRARDRTIR